MYQCHSILECLFLEIEHTSWMDVEAVVPFIFALTGVFLTSGTIYVVVKNHETAIMKASTRELCYITLAGIILAHM